MPGCFRGGDSRYHRARICCCLSLARQYRGTGSNALPAGLPLHRPPSISRRRLNISGISRRIDKFEVEPVKMGKSAVSAARRKPAAPDNQTMRPEDAAMSAGCGCIDLPHIVAIGLHEHPFRRDILDPGNVDTGRMAGTAHYFSPERRRIDALIGHRPAMVTVRTIDRGEKRFAHGSGIPHRV